VPKPDVVLVVDDDPAVRTLAARWLTQGGQQVVELDGGEAALAWLSASPGRVAAMVLDVMMPGLDGYQVLMAMREHDDMRDIPVVLLTAHATTDDDILQGIELGAFDHLEKPFRGPILSARVRALVDKRREDFESRLRLKAAESHALKDALTGLGNRRHFDASLAREVSYSTRHKQPLSLAIVDLDFFKSINDLFGHPEGDRVLAHVASQLAAGLRGSDEAFRLGGEEFCLLLRGTDAEAAARVVARLREQVKAEPMLLGEQDERTITFSGGIASAESGNAFNAENLLDRADRALYRAKQSGRDRVELETAV
jgi:diguanylate cyclase (GGDEF)-like protein